MKVGAFVVLCLLLAACDRGPYALSESERETTELGARDFAERMGGKYISCSGQDSDGDSYVTCTMTDPAGATVNLLCSYKSRGCKLK